MSLPKNVVHDKSNPADGVGSPRGDAPIAIFATLTGKGRSAVAVIGVRGDDVESMIRTCFRPASEGAWAPGQIRYGAWVGPDEKSIAENGILGESVVVVPLGARSLEIHSHGGTAAVGRIEDDLRSVGAVPADPLTWIAPESNSRIIREAHQVLARCVTARTAAVAMDQVRGALERWARGVLRQLDADTFVAAAVGHEVRTLCQRARIGVRLAEPFDVVLIGPPNVGKSSLVNALVGYERSIALDAPGTTRDVLVADTVIDGLPVRLSDTAGIRPSDEAIEREGIARAWRAAEHADLLICVSEPGQVTKLPPTVAPRLDVLNKRDRLPRGADSVSSPGGDRSPSIATNALSGEGVDVLLLAIATALNESFPGPGQAVPVTERQATLVARIGDAIVRDTFDRDTVRSLVFRLLGDDRHGETS